MYEISCFTYQNILHDLFLGESSLKVVCLQYISNLFSSCTSESKTRAAQFTKLRNSPINNSHREKRMKARVFPSSKIQFESKLHFFSLLLDINVKLCFKLIKVSKNLQQNFKALFHNQTAYWPDDFVRLVRQKLAVKTRERKYVKSRIVN